jgi:lysophospholipase L1-like esterase
VSPKRLETCLVAVLAAVLAVLMGGPAWAAGTSDTDGTHSYYLALGDSLAIGVQPDAAGNLQTTDSGYADLLFGRLGAADPTLQLVNLGCSGETVTTFLAGGICDYALGSQLKAAVAFLVAHRADVRLVTINLGGNDIGGCADFTGIDTTCVQQAMDRIRVKLSIAMVALRAAAGAGVPIVGMNFYDPVLAFWLFGRPDIALGSLPVTADVNDLLERVYGSVGAAVADVETAFSTFVTTPVDVPGIGEVPLNVARICQLTWMCAPPPVGPNTHPNDDGYRVIADAFAAEI